MVGLFNKIKDAGAPRSDNGTQQGITDLSSVGGTWEGAVRHLCESRAGAKTAIAYIKDGTRPASSTVVGPPILEVGKTRAHDEPRLAMAMVVHAARKNGDAGRRAANLFGVYPWGLRPAQQLQGITQTLPVSTQSFSLADLRELSEMLGWPEGLIESEFLNRQYGTFSGIDGIEELVEANAGALREKLANLDKGSIWVLQRIHQCHPNPELIIRDEICGAATANSKQLREKGRKLFDDMSNEAKIAGLTSVLETATAARRARVVELAGRLDPGPDQDDFIAVLQDRLKGDKSAAVRRALEELDQSIAEHEPPPPALPELHEIRDLDDAFTQRFFYSTRYPTAAYRHDYLDHRKLAKAFAEHDPLLSELEPPQLCRVLYPWMASPWLRNHYKPILAHVAGTRFHFSPLDLSQVMRFEKRAETEVVLAVSGAVACDPGFWSDDTVTEWSRYYMDEIIAHLFTSGFEDMSARSGFHDLIAKINPKPPRLKSQLLAAAINGPKRDRAAFQRLAEPESADPLGPYLASRKKTERLGAAEFLRVNVLPGVEELLLTAARKEKDDGVLVSLLMALEANGASIDEFVSRDALLAQATSKKNTTPKAIQWLEVDHLPEVTWNDGEPVDKAILQSFINTAVKSKSAEPSPLTIRHFDNMNAAEVRAFGEAVFSAWIARDTATFSPAESREKAEVAVAQNHARMSAYTWHEWHGTTPEEAVEISTAAFSKTMIGSETHSKGVLGVVAAAGGDASVIDRAGVFIRKHRGNRLSQGKALLQMLAWIDDPAATQLLLSIAGRFRPKSLQKFAAEQAELLAERRGWTMDDLTDRSVPDGGFDASGRRVFDFGERTFTALLGDDLTVSLVNDASGKTVRALPKGRADEDAELIGEFRKDLSAAKKELKTVAKLQPERLHLAMCGQRSWAGDDFMRYFVAHPVMARLASRLVWLSAAGDERAVAFRPLTDGTLVTVDDDEFTLPENASVTIAHELVMAGDSDAWISHFSDYEVTPLFAQFNRPKVEVAEGQTTIDEFVGYQFNDGSFRGQLNKIGWQLGQPEDNGWVNAIVKEIPGSDLRAVVDLAEGLPIDGYNIGENTVVLDRFYFVDSEAYSDSANATEFERCPPIMLSEAYAELQALKSNAEGHNPKYKR